MTANVWKDCRQANDNEEKEYMIRSKEKMLQGRWGALGSRRGIQDPFKCSLKVMVVLARQKSICESSRFRKETGKKQGLCLILTSRKQKEGWSLLLYNDCLLQPSILLLFCQRFVPDITSTSGSKQIFSFNCCSLSFFAFFVYVLATFIAGMIKEREMSVTHPVCEEWLQMLLARVSTKEYQEKSWK